jgi:hypothetical protein
MDQHRVFNFSSGFNYFGFYYYAEVSPLSLADR